MTILTLVPDADQRWFVLADKYGVPIDGQVKTIVSEVDNIVTVDATFAVYGGIQEMPDNDLQKAFAAWGALSEDNRQRFLRAVVNDVYVWRNVLDPQVRRSHV
jgi:hypothetical protein